MVGWMLPTKETFKDSSVLKASLIIPFRNEEHNLPQLIDSVNKQTVSGEVIFIDDHSTDASVNIIGLDKFNVLLNNGIGKKSASATGIENAKNDLLVFTDADCVLPSDHLENILITSRIHPFDFAYGPVLYSDEKSSIKNSVFFLDQLSLNAFALGTGKLNVHLYCSGANMAGKKSTLIKSISTLYSSNNLSGDDMSLLNYCTVSHKKIIALTDKKFAVITNSPATLAGFLKQRLRWGQKTGFNSNVLLLLVSATVLLSSCAVIYSLIASISEFWSFHWVLLPLGKLLIDLLFLFLVSYRLGVMRHLWFFIPAWLFNIVYIPMIGLTGLVYSGKWKGRKIRA